MTNRKSSDKRPRLTVAMIVRDMAHELAATLESIRSIADEVVVADLGSADGSLDVARGSANIVLETEWQDDLAAARNECVRRATGDWVLWVEPGETLDETAAEQLRNFLDDAADPGKAYLMFVQRPAVNAANSCEQIGQLRLIPNRAGLRFAGRVREQILPSVRDAGLGVDALECAFQRAALEVDPDRARNAALQKLNLANLALTEEGEGPRPLLARAEALAELGRAKEAGVVYRRTVEAAERGSSEMLEAYYGLLTSMDADPAAAELQMTTCLKALEVYPLDAQLLCGMGGYLLRSRRLDLAARSYEMAATHGAVDPSIWHLADLADVAVVCWSLVLQLLGEAAKAEAVISAALADRPDSLRLRRQLIDMLIKAGKEREALAQCELLPAGTRHWSALRDVIRGAVLAAGKNYAAALLPLHAAYRAGCRDSLCLRWLAGAQVGLSNWADAAAVVAEWERLEPSSLEVTAIRRAIEQQRSGASKATHMQAERRRVDKPSQLGLPIDAPTTVSRPSTPAR